MVEGLHDDAAAIWTAYLESLDGAGSTHKAWLAQIRPVAVAGDTLVLAVPDEFVKEWIEQRYAPTVTGALARVVGRPLDIHVTVGPLEDTGDEEQARPPIVPLPAADRPLLTPKYTFERFVIGSSNRFAHAAAVAVAEAPAKSYNPLFIYGGAGLGKTHLLHAIAHYVRQNYPDYKVGYLSIEVFTNEFIDAIRTNAQTAFKRRYRDLDVLLIDDIQFLEHKEATQEEFFHTFNSLHGSNRQVVISSDRQPDAIATLEDRLRSRFKWGLITDIQPPDLETRIAILRKKADRDSNRIPADVLEFIATHITDNIRELEGALIRVTAYASLNNEPLTPELAERVLGDILTERQPRPITPALILEATAKMFGFTVEEIKDRSRRRPLVTARQVGMYVCRELTDLSYPAIAREFGGRDHTTVIHAVSKIETLMEQRPRIYEQVTELTQRIRNSG